VIGIDGRPGAFADFVDVPPENLHVLPAGLPERAGALVEPLAAALKGLEDGEIEPHHRTAVLGDGPIGLLTALGIARAGGEPVLIGRHREKLARVEGVGVQVRLAGGEGPGSDASAFDRVVDCTGRSEGLGLALRLVRPRGVVVLKTTVAEPHRVDLAPLVIDEVRIVGSRCGDFRRAISFLEAEAQAVERLITEVYPLEAWREAFDRAADPVSLKVLIRIGAPEA
jgi:threonine dehydrogenase-like Zn-dependent dehydrogenase